MTELSQMVETQILPQLDKVKQVGRDKWKACCPAHNDSNPSFQVMISERGNVLMKCWSGCTVDEICGSIGIRVTDLFAEKSQPPGRPLAPTEDSFFVAMYKSDVKRGVRPTPEETAKYRKIVARVAY